LLLLKEYLLKSGISSSRSLLQHLLLEEYLLLLLKEGLLQGVHP